MKFWKSYCLPNTTSPFEWSVDEYLKNQQKHTNLCEVLNDDAQDIHPYFDFDLKFPASGVNAVPPAAPTTSELNKWVEYLSLTTKNIFSNFDAANATILVAYRPPSFIQERSSLYYKISIRIFVTSLKTTKQLLAEHVAKIKFNHVLLAATKEREEKEEDNVVSATAFAKLKSGIGKENVFDVSVYSQNRKMNCIGKTKTRTDQRSLLPYPGFEQIALQDFLIQNVGINDIDASYNTLQTTKLRGRKRSSSNNTTVQRPPRKVVKQSIETDDTTTNKMKEEEEIDEDMEDNDIESTSANVPKELTAEDKIIITNFIHTIYHHTPNKIRDIVVDKAKNCIVVALTEKYCYFKHDDHHSNYQYIVIDTGSSKQKCHDSECANQKHNEINVSAFPVEINVIIKNVLKINKIELDLIDKAIEECKSYIQENFDEQMDKIQFDKNEMVFRGNVENKQLTTVIGGKCKVCQVEHQISNSGYCMKCMACNSIFPKNQVIPVDDRFKHLTNFWMNYNQLVNNGTVNILNIYNNSGDLNKDDFSDVQLDGSIFSDNDELTKIYNQILDGHKVTKIAEAIYHENKEYVYSKSMWYHFDGKVWKQDDDNLAMKKTILDSTNILNKVVDYYRQIKQPSSAQLVKNVKNLVVKLNKPNFKDDIIKEAKMFYNEPDFMTKLNSKKHLIPFTNGVFDLIKREFRQTTKEDYINLTVNFDYLNDDDSNNGNPEVYKFLNEVLPKQNIRDYVLKKMSECLNGDIANTYFLMFIGDSGANGKSQLLNLMKLTLGELAEKVEVTLLTRKRNNANEANSEKVKLHNKRFAFLSEPEDGEKINISLLKELTGSEEIVARGLFKDSVTFVMEAKLFLACNELPEIKGEDTALWRRIRVVDFPSKFVDEPNQPGEFKIDRSLPSRMREDVTWRQTFMKILIDYYYKNVKEPEEVKMKTNEYRQENNDFYVWLSEKLINKQGGILKLVDVCEMFLGKKVGPRAMAKYRKELEKYMKENYPSIDNTYKQFWVDGQKYNGWQNFEIRCD